MQSKDEDEEFNPNWVSPPGDTIRDCIEIKGLDFKEFASQLILGEPQLHQLLRGELEIDFRLAQRFHYTLGIDAQFWINREKNYRDKLKELNK